MQLNISERIKELKTQYNNETGYNANPKMLEKWVEAKVGKTGELLGVHYWVTVTFANALIRDFLVEKQFTLKELAELTSKHDQVESLLKAVQTKTNEIQTTQSGFVTLRFKMHLNKIGILATDDEAFETLCCFALLKDVKAL